MAYVPKTKEEEEALNLSAPKTVPGTESGGQLQQATPTPSMKSPNNSGMSAFTDVGAYLDANKEQGVQLGQQIAGNVENAAKGAQAAVDKTANKFQESVSAGTFRPGDTRIEEAATDPMGFLKDPVKAGSFKNAAKNIYNGPSQIEELPEYADASSKVTEGNRVLGLSGTASGRRELISALEKNPTAGQTAFDEMIFGQNPDAVEKVSTAAQRFGDLENYLGGKKGETASFAQQAAADRAASQGAILGRMGSEKSKIKGSVQSQIEAKRQALSDMLSGYKNSGFADYSWTPEELSAIGLGDTDLADVNRGAGALKGDYGDTVNPGDYFGQSYIPGEVNDANQITPEQIARYEALSELIGSPNDYVNANMKAAATPVPTQLGTLDRTGLSGSIGSKLSAADQATLDALTDSIKESGKDGGDSILNKASVISTQIVNGKKESGLQSRQRAGNEIIKVFTDAGLTPPFTAEDVAQDKVKYGIDPAKQYSDSFREQSAVKAVGGFGKQSVLSRTKYDPLASFRGKKTSFGDGGGYGIY